MPAPGTITGYRPRPKDFREVYAQLGIGDELLEHYRTNFRVLRRWIDEIGYDELHEARREYLRQTRWPNGAPGNRKRPHCFAKAQAERKTCKRSDEGYKLAQGHRAPSP